MIRVLLIIDVPFYRQGLASLLDQSGEAQVIGAVSGTDAIEEIVARETPDVILLDTGATGARQTLTNLHASDSSLHVVALAINETAEGIAEWAGTQVLGYVSRGASLADLLQCLRCAARGEAYCSPRVMSILLNRFASIAPRPNPAAARVGDLTAREREILELIGNGLSNKLIAGRLHISHATAKNHVHHILDKLELRSRSQVAAYLHAQTQAKPGAQGGH